MKTKFFRNNAPVIPTPSTSLGAGSAKRSGGISRLTHNATITAYCYCLLLLLLLLCPVVLAAQNGVKVSDLNVNAGTVTFNVSWDRTSPELQNIVWSDTVWVFVDYNDNGTMKRLELLPGATLTNPSWSGASITQPNNQGVWVAGNARSAGSFSATVQLLSTIAEISGACVYASNYPPVAEYRTAQTIKFTGTPPYDLELSSGSSDQAYGNYNLLPGQTLVSFTDKTGAPGEINCVPPATPQVALDGASTVCQGTNVVFKITAPEAGVSYTWSGCPGAASGPGDGTYTAGGEVAGYGTAVATALRMFGSTTCASAPSTPAAALWLPKGNLSDSIPACGCASPYLACKGTCQSACTPSYYAAKVPCPSGCPRGRSITVDECRAYAQAVGVSAWFEDGCYKGTSAKKCNADGSIAYHTNNGSCAYCTLDYACVE